MKILKKDLRHGKLTLAVQSVDDLWHLSQVVEAGDLVSSRTTRKIKATDKESSKKTLTLEVSAEAVEFKDSSLRVSGVTTEEKEDIPKGSHHTLSIEEGSVVSVSKKSWPRFMLVRVEQAIQRQPSTLILVLDREEAVFALLKSQGYEILAHLKGRVAKKGYETVTSDFYGELRAKLSDCFSRYRPDAVVVASPAFWKDEFAELLDDEMRKRVVLAGCSSVGTNAVEEVLRRPELSSVLKQQRASQESRLVEGLMAEISREGLAAYGRKEVEASVQSGNARQLLITDSFIASSREAGEQLMKAADSVKAEVMIINSGNEAGKKLDSLGGIGVLLRYHNY